MATSTVSAHPGTHGGCEPPAKKANLGGDAEVNTEFVQKEDIWLQILSFVGPGHFAYVAGVSHQFKEWYNKASFAGIGEPPKVYKYYERWVDESTRFATKSDTFFRAAFSSIACANFWKDYPMRNLSPNIATALSAKYGTLEIYEWMGHQGFGRDWGSLARAAEGGNSEVLGYLRDHGFQWRHVLCVYAAQYGQLECLKYLRKNGCRWDMYTCIVAARKGHLDCLEYAHKNNCWLHEYTCVEAAENGHLDCLEYVNDAKGNDRTPRWEKSCVRLPVCNEAAKNGHLECLKYARANGWWCDETTCSAAAQNGHLECLKYLRDSGCAWNEETYIAAQEAGYEEIAEWARNNGCPVGEESDDSDEESESSDEESESSSEESDSSGEED